MGRLIFCWIFVAIAAAGCGAAVKKADDGGQHADATSVLDGNVSDGKVDASSPHDAIQTTDVGGSTGDGAAAPDAALPDAAVPDGGAGDGGTGLVLLEGSLVTVGGTATAGALTLEDDGFEGLGPNCSADGSLCLLFGGLGP
jgi:hypothetical protein